MPGKTPKTDKAEIVRNEVTAYLHEVSSAEDGSLVSLDHWTLRRIIGENMAKIALVFEAEDPVEHCYQNLVREIDTEAEVGIYLVGTDRRQNDWRVLTSDPGISGELYRDMYSIAPVVFPDELSHSQQGMDIVWVTIHARFDRAKIDATVSELIMAHLQRDDVSVSDMTDALRLLLYAFHEDVVRRLVGMPLILSKRSTRELMTMVSELARRAGDYERRVEAIANRAGTT